MGVAEFEGVLGLADLRVIGNFLAGYEDDYHGGGGEVGHQSSK